MGHGASLVKSSLIQYAFNGGQLGPRLQGRSDLARYQTGCNKLQNFIPTYQGPAIKRSGFRHVKPVKDSSKKTRIIPFEFSREQAYIMELGEGYLRVYKDSGTVLEAAQSFTAAPTTDPTVVCADTGHPFANGDQVFITGSAMTELNDRYFTVANQATDTYELSGEVGTGRTTGAGGTAARVYEISDADAASNSLPWLEAELDAISFVQSADVVYLAHGNHPPHKISRTSDIEWTSEAIDFDWPPFRENNLDDDQTMIISENTGSSRTITATGAGSIFVSAMVGSHVRISQIVEADIPKWKAAVNVAGGIEPRVSTANEGVQVYYEGRVYSLTAVPAGSTGNEPPSHEKSDGVVKDKSCSWEFYNRGAGYAKITAVGGATCTVDVVEDFPFRVSTTNPLKTAYGGTDFDALTSPRWSIGAWSAEYGYPRAVSFYEDRLWFGGTSKDPQTMWASKTGDYENFEVVAGEDDSSLVFTLASDKINSIEWMSGQDVLIIGTKGGEFTADAGNAEQAITPSNIRVRRRSNYGAAENVQPVFIDSALLFVQRAKFRLHELVPSLQSGNYTAADLTQMSYDILTPGVVQMAYQSSPLRLLWCVLSDGSLASLTYISDEEVIAWAKHTIGGTNATVESIAVIPHPDGDQDQLWAITSRTVNGATVRHIEFLEKPFAENGSIPDAFFVDDGLSLSTSTSMSDMTGVFTVGGNSAIYFGSDPTGIFEIGDWVEINGISTVDFPIDAAALNGVRVLVTGVAANNISVENAEGEGLDLSGLPTPGGYVGPGTVSLSITTVTGLHHLEGETVKVLGDGVVHPDAVVSNGSITLITGVTKAQVGLALPDAHLQTMRLEGGNPQGTAQGKKKRITKLVIRLKDTAEGIKYGANFTTMDEHSLRDTADLMDSFVPLFSGDTPPLSMPSGWEREGRVAISHDLPLPCTVIAIMPDMNTEVI